MVARRLIAEAETWALAQAFTISRGSRTETRTIRVELHQDGFVGRGEAVPNTRYGETVENQLTVIDSVRAALESGLDRAGLTDALPHGTARNALDCALWDLEAKRTGIPVWQAAGLPEPKPVITVYTISLGTPEVMAAEAAKQAHRPLLKLKLGGGADLERVAAVRAAAPNARLVVDANEAWTPDFCRQALPALAAMGVQMVEQPLPAGADGALADMPRPVMVCADESLHDRGDLRDLSGRYDAINIKLDKSGGLTEGLALARDAQALGLKLMIGCMVGTSLGMAPAHLLAQWAEVVDIDAPLLLATDRQPGLSFDGSLVHPPTSALWG
ncbi:MAG: dipeptide epimerase [Alphaproteobacteria bacterium]|nr:N-acetyl-D-Glu racemase DgcA [Alphaproteobacteria bacterium]TAD90164.1 MAG: dipeptide epimerase [Alphaproteobacteria bacterium]